MIAAGRGVFAGPEIAIRGRTAAIDFYLLTEVESEFELFAIWKKQSQIDPTISKFMKIMQEAIKPAEVAGKSGNQRYAGTGRSASSKFFLNLKLNHHRRPHPANLSHGESLRCSGT